MQDKIKIIIADDHPLLRHGLRQIIQREPDLFIVAECGDGNYALAEIKRLSPDLAILDVTMPDADGLDVLRRLREQQNMVKVILLTVHDEAELFEEALRLGAHGYVLKECAIEEIITAVRAVANDQNYISQKLNRKKFPSFNRNCSNELTNLTATERQILKLIAEYKSSDEIARLLSISPHTVKTHRRNMNAKLQIEGNNALMRFALENKKLI